jgi:NAD+ kinase
MKIKRIGIVAKKLPKAIKPLLEEVRGWCRKEKIELWAEEWLAELGPADRLVPRGELGDQVDLLIVFGGDGTLLSAAHSGKKKTPPIVGINLGHLGFLTQFNKEELGLALQVIGGEPVLSHRHCLAVGLWRGGKRLQAWRALNDAVINKGTMARMIELKTSVDGRLMTIYKSDGVIVSTPTGSTAYSMAAGGPIVHPKVPCVLVAPICPHTLSQRTMVLPEMKRLEIEVLSEPEEVYLTIDGQFGRDLKQGDRVRIEPAPSPIELVRSPRRDYFEVLRQKLKWGER